MMIFTSKYSDYTIAIDVPGGHRTLRFAFGVLDVSTAARQTGLSEERIKDALLKSRYYGVDFVSADKETCKEPATNIQVPPITPTPTPKVDNFIPVPPPSAVNVASVKPKAPTSKKRPAPKTKG